MSDMLVSREQFNSLPPIGMELYDYWTTRDPELCRDMQSAGLLWERLSSEGIRLHSMLLELVGSGASVNAAVEAVRADYRSGSLFPCCALGA